MSYDIIYSLSNSNNNSKTNIYGETSVNPYHGWTPGLALPWTQSHSDGYGNIINNNNKDLQLWLADDDMFVDAIFPDF